MRYLLLIQSDPNAVNPTPPDDRLLEEIVASTQFDHGEEKSTSTPRGT